MASVKPLCSIVDIGGDKYFMGEGRPLEYAIKTREEFNVAYADLKLGKNIPHPRIPALMCYYFPFSPIGNAKRPEIQADDIDLVVNTLNQRIKNLEESIKISNTSLYAQRNRKIANNLKDIVRSITKESETPDKAVEIEGVREATKVLEKEYKNQDAAFDALVEFAWFMLHPEEVPGTVKTKWAELIKELKNLNIRSVIQQIKNESKEESDIPIEPLNYFSRLDLSEVIKKDTLQSALDKAKEQAIADLRNKQRKQYAERLKSIVTILHLHGYLSTDGMNKITDTSLNSVDRFISDVSSSLVNKIGYSLDPIFNYFKKIYDPAYTFVDTSVKTFIGRNIKIPIDDLINLITYSNILLLEERKPGQTYTSKYGIMRITNVKPELIDFLRSINVEIEKELRKEGDGERAKSKLYRQLLSLPILKPVDIAQQAIQRMNALSMAGIFLSEQIVLPDEKKFGDVFSKLLISNRVDYDKLRKANKLTSDFFPKGYKAMTEYFIPNCIYIVNGNNQDYPNAAPYRLWTIDMKDTTMAKKEFSDAITQFQKDNGITFSLGDIVSSAGLYVNTPLLAMFSLIAFKSQLSTAKVETIEEIEEEGEISLEDEMRAQSDLDKKKELIKKEIDRLLELGIQRINNDTRLTDKGKGEKIGKYKSKKDEYYTQIDNVVDMDGFDAIIANAKLVYTPILTTIQTQQMAGMDTPAPPIGVQYAQQIQQLQQMAAPTVTNV
jgi:hypothetical protein